MAEQLEDFSIVVTKCSINHSQRLRKMAVVVWCETQILEEGNSEQCPACSVGLRAAADKKGHIPLLNKNRRSSRKGK